MFKNMTIKKKLACYIISALKRAIEALSRESEQVSSVSSQVSAASQSLAEGVTEQAAGPEETSSRLEAGKDFTIDGLLKQGFQAVFTATGGWDSRLARGDIDKAETVFPGAYLLIDLLRSKSDNTINIAAGENVVIAGGGIRVPEAVKILKENGSKKIIIISRGQKEEACFAQETFDELSKAGVTFIYNSGITKVMGEEDNLKAIELLEFETGVKNIINTDTLILGSGRFPELVFIPVKKEIQEGEETLIEKNGPLEWEGVELPKKPDSNKELGLLSSQDTISEYASAVAAINGGRKAAAAIHNLMYGIQFQESSKIITEKTILQDVSCLNNVAPVPRNIMELGQEKKDSIDKFSTGFSEEQARAEASRCLRCGLVCYEKSRVVG